VTDAIAIARLRLAATLRTRGIEHDRPHGGSVADLIDAWFDRQQSLPHDCPSRRADTTLAENKREAENLRSAFGHLPVAALRRCDAYRYLDHNLLAKRHRAAKANKEISLMHTILEYGVRLGMLDTNPFDGVTRLPTVARDIYVPDEALSLTIEIGRRLGGPSLVVALALRTAFLCLRRSREVRGLTRAQIGKAGIQWMPRSAATDMAAGAASSCGAMNCARRSMRRWPSSDRREHPHRSGARLLSHVLQEPELNERLVQRHASEAADVLDVLFIAEVADAQAPAAIDALDVLDTSWATSSMRAPTNGPISGAQ